MRAESVSIGSRSLTSKQGRDLNPYSRSSRILPLDDLLCKRCPRCPTDKRKLSDWRRIVKGNRHKPLLLFASNLLDNEVCQIEAKWVASQRIGLVQFSEVSLLRACWVLVLDARGDDVGAEMYRVVRIFILDSQRPIKRIFFEKFNQGVVPVLLFDPRTKASVLFAQKVLPECGYELRFHVG